jgi:hypothetical protein
MRYTEQPRDVKFKRLTLYTGRTLDGWIQEKNTMLGKPTIRFHVTLDSSGKYCGSAHWIAVDEVAKIEDLAYDPHKTGKRIEWL